MKNPKKNKNLLHSIVKNTKDSFVRFQEKMGRLKKEHGMFEASKLAAQKTLNGEKKVVVDISAASVARSAAVVLLLVLSLYFLYQISGILVIFFVAFLFAAALDPMVASFQRYRIPRSLGVLLIYLLIFLFVGLLISSLVPLIAKQVVDIARNVGEFVRNLTTDGSTTNFPFAEQLRPYLTQLYQAVDLQTAATQIQSALQVLASQLLNISFGLINVLLVLILTFFMTVEEKAMEQFYLSLFPSRYGQYISTRLEAVKQKIGYWLRGQLLLSLVAMILSYVGLLILNVDYALTLSIIAGIMMVIPVVGRVFAWILTMPVVLNQSPLLALWVSIYYFVLQQVENNVLVPYIMNKAVGLSPIIIIFAMLVGAQYLGILGLVISIPIATTVAIFVKDYLEKTK